MKNIIDTVTFTICVYHDRSVQANNSIKIRQAECIGLKKGQALVNTQTSMVCTIYIIRICNIV